MQHPEFEEAPARLLDPIRVPGLDAKSRLGRDPTRDSGGARFTSTDGAPFEFIATARGHATAAARSSFNISLQLFRERRPVTDARLTLQLFQCVFH